MIHLADTLIGTVREFGGSDLHISVNEYPVMRLNGKLTRLEAFQKMTNEAIIDMANYLQKLPAGTPVTEDTDFCYEGLDSTRQRVNVYKQRGSVSIALRMLNSRIPSFEDLRLPDTLKEICSQHRGLILVTGATGSGKSTTLAAMTDYINSRSNSHIITIEDPVEYVHQSKNCLITQREVGDDTSTFSSALRSALREDPDVILVGEMRDLDTISAAITAAETGHLVMSTLHTTGAAKTIDRIIDVFPLHQQTQVRTQLATVLRAVITQTLLPTADGRGRIAAYEIMILNDAIANLIRENKTFQINGVMQMNAKNGMILLDMHLAQLYKNGTITRETALDNCVNKDEFRRFAGISA